MISLILYDCKILDFKLNLDCIKTQISLFLSNSVKCIHRSVMMFWKSCFGLVFVSHYWYSLYAKMCLWMMLWTPEHKHTPAFTRHTFQMRGVWWQYVISSFDCYVFVLFPGRNTKVHRRGKTHTYMHTHAHFQMKFILLLSLCVPVERQEL